MKVRQVVVEPPMSERMGPNLGIASAIPSISNMRQERRTQRFQLNAATKHIPCLSIETFVAILQKHITNIKAYDVTMTSCICLQELNYH